MMHLGDESKIGAGRQSDGIVTAEGGPRNRGEWGEKKCIAWERRLWAGRRMACGVKNV